MMQLHDLEIRHLKDIPGYKAILKAVLKSQIQILVEQLADHTGEESVLLTASITDGTLSHLGTSTGKHFIEGRDEIKSQFLSFCLKKQDRRRPPQSPEAANMPEVRPRPRMHPSQQSHHPPRVHPVSMSRAPGPGSRYSEGRMHKRTYPTSSVFRPGHESTPSKQSRIPTETYASPYDTSPRTETQQQSPLHSGATTVPDPSMSSIQQIDLSEQNVKLEKSSFHDPGESDLGEDTEQQLQTFEPSSQESAQSSATPTTEQSQFDVNTSESQPGDSDLSNIISSIPAVSESQGDDGHQAVVKVESITEGEMELEITGVEMAGGSESFSADSSWVPDMSGYGASTSGTDGDTSGMAGNQSGISQNRGGSAATSSGTPVRRSRRRRQQISKKTREKQTGDAKDDFEMESSESEAADEDLDFQETTTTGRTRGRRVGRGSSLGRARKPYICEFCGRVYNTVRQLKDHVIDHTGEKPRFSCGVCGRGFKRKLDMKKHESRHPNEEGRESRPEKPYICDQCGAAFRKKIQLKEHSFNHSQEAKPYPCEICERSFKRKLTLINHRKTHDKPKLEKTAKQPIICEVCGKHFKKQFQFKEHFVNHTGEKRRFPCDVCGKGFKRKLDMENHKRIHLEEKPFTCEVCGKEYRWKHALKKCMKKHAAAEAEDVSGATNTTSVANVIVEADEQTLALLADSEMLAQIRESVAASDSGNIVVVLHDREERETTLQDAEQEIVNEEIVESQPADGEPAVGQLTVDQGTVGRNGVEHVD